MAEVIKGGVGFSSSVVEAIQGVEEGAAADEEIGDLSILPRCEASQRC
jgi:hypothetical protein